jgi:hypothetical protein
MHGQRPVAGDVRLFPDIPHTLFDVLSQTTLLQNTSLTMVAQKLVVVESVSGPPHGENQAPE